MPIEHRVRKFVVDDCVGNVPQEIGKDESQLGAGNPDSIGLYRFIFFLRETYGPTVVNEEIRGTNFATLLKISKFGKLRTIDQHV